MKLVIFNSSLSEGPQSIFILEFVQRFRGLVKKYQETLFFFRFENVCIVL
jgi:hypothetical protein